MANDTYSMPSPIPGMSFVYDKATDDPVGVTTPDGKEVKFGGPGATTPAAVLSAQLASMQGTLGALYVLSDGTDAGAKLTWAVPRGESQPTWCWWLWPQAAYQ